MESGDALAFVIVKIGSLRICSTDGAAGPADFEPFRAGMPDSK
jgi:hypothetical protein